MTQPTETHLCDNEVRDLVTRINEGNVFSRAEIVEDISAATENHYSNLSLRARGDYGLNFDAAESISYAEDPNSEAEDDKIQRLLDHFRSLRDTLPIRSHETVIVESDDFYGIGIRTQIDYVPTIIEEWANLPHGMFIFPESGLGAQVVTFIGTSYIFSSR